MRRISIDELRPGMKMARTIHYHYGGVMLSAGATVEEKQISRLKTFGLKSIYIYDKDISQAVVYDYIDEKARGEITKNVTKLYGALRSETQKLISPDELYQSSTQEIRRKLDNRQFRKFLYRAKIQASFLNDVEKIIDGILSDEKLCLCVGTIKTNQSHIYDHSLEVTLHAAILGKKLGFTRGEMKEMLLGSLLHDIGYIFIPEDVLKKKEPRTEKEEALLKQHTIYGYYLLKTQPDIGLLSAHVAYQHHEQQDGNGFPRRLKGINRIVRPGETIADTAGMIHRYADVVAVPNFYDNLISNQTDRPALPPDEAARKVKEAAGTILNREVVEVFLSYLPVYPVGTQIYVLQGEYAGYRGVVSRTTPDDLEHPLVILVEHKEKRLKEPIEVDLRKRDDVKIRAIWS